MADNLAEAEAEVGTEESNIVDSIGDIVLPDKKKEEFKSSLLQHISTKLVDAKYAREKVDDEMLAFANIRRGRYDDSTLEKIKRLESGSTYYDPVGRTKCRAGIALIEDIFSPSDGKPWSMENTPVPDLPEDKRDKVKENVLQQFQPILDKMNVMTKAEQDEVNAQIEEASSQAFEIALELDQAEAKEKAKKMEVVITDQMVEGHHKEAQAEFVSNLVTYPSAFLKGPLPRKEKAIEHKKVNGKYIQKVIDKVKLVFEAPSPLDIYPSPDQIGIDDGYFFERMYLDRKYLSNLKGVEGYNEDGIDRVLEEYGKKGLQVRLDTDQERQEIENKDFKDGIGGSEKIEVFEYWGSVQGKLLIEWGYKGDGSDEVEELGEYEITAWVTADMKNIIRCVLNPDPLGRRPYQMTSYMKVPNAFWGECVPSLMLESQRFLNSLSRAIENNAQIASGPQIFINDISRIPEGASLTNITPWQIWQFQAPHAMHSNQSSGDVIKFEQPSIHVSEINNIKNETRQRIDEETGIPTFSHGGTGGPDTARTLAMLMSSSSKIIKQVIRNIDTVTENLIRRLYEYNMLNHEDEDIKGDVTIIPQGALSLIVKEQTQVRLNELLAITNNPTDNQIIDIVHRGRILREITKDLDLPANSIIPTEEELQKIQSGALQQEVIQQLTEQDPIIGMLLSGEIKSEDLMAMIEQQQQTGPQGAGSQGNGQGSGSGQAKKQGPAPATGSGMAETDSQPETDLGKLYQ